MRIGDLFGCGDADALAHGCNCAGAMGAGIAVQFKKRWPDMFLEYKRRCEDGSFAPGSVFLWERSSPKVFNLGTQAHWRVGATEAAVRDSVALMLRTAEAMSMRRVAMPRIGAGLGGLPWTKVESLLREAAAGSRVELAVYTLT